tara:strand:- start:34 stop:1191 length:1158 start_codon:yes stop_codon:yes gene_type:complete
MKINVLGGGIAGLASAIFLSKQGHEVTVVERNNFNNELGAGIQITPNAIRVFDALGIRDDFIDLAEQPTSLNIRRAENKALLQKVSIHKLVENQKVGFYHLHRHKLINLLRDNAIKHKVKIISNQNINKIITTKDHVRICSTDIEYDSDVLIGADGLNSISRKKLNEDYKPKYSGFCAFRTISKLEKGTDKFLLEPNLFLQKNAHMVTYPLNGNELNCVLVAKQNKQELESWHLSSTIEQVEESTFNFDNELQNLFNASSSINKWGLFFHYPKNWFDTRVLIIGDAAHPMLPFMAQGACSALEDSLVLDHVFKKYNDHSEIFTNFVSMRQKRVKRIQDLSRNNRIIFHLGNRTRDLFFCLNSKFPAYFESRQQSVYKYNFFTEVN